MRKNNEFLESLKVKSTSKPNEVFPTDEDILKNMENADEWYSFDLKDIDKKIKIKSLTREGEQLFLYREKINKSTVLGYDSLHSQYYVLNMEGKVIGRVPVYTNNPNELGMDYEIDGDFQGKGIGTIVLSEVIDQIFEKKEFDGVAFSSLKYPDVTETAINNINLEISDENEASKKIATKNGFKEDGKRAYKLTLKDYEKQKSDEGR